jgi:hypothetical protein
MNSYELETTIAGPVQLLGMSFYFDPGTAAAAGEFDMNVFEYYGLGRGGVLGNVSGAVVGEAFWFFHPTTVDALWNSGLAKGEPVAVAKSHLNAAYAWADRTFAGVSETVMRNYADASRKAIDAVPGGKYALFDGYRSFPVPESAVHAAYLATILFRELRGGIHIDTTREMKVEPNEACFISNESIFKLHGYGDVDAPERTAELVERMANAEELTTKTMASYLDVLTDDERGYIAAGVTAMNDTTNPPEIPTPGA